MAITCQNLLNFVDDCQKYSKPKQCHFRETMTVRTQISGVHVPQVVQILVRKGGITNYCPITYSLSNISAKNYQNRLMCVKLWCATSVSFFRQCACIAQYS